MIRGSFKGEFVDIVRIDSMTKDLDKSQALMSIPWRYTLDAQLKQKKNNVHAFTHLLCTSN